MFLHIFNEKIVKKLFYGKLASSLLTQQCVVLWHHGAISHLAVARDLRGAGFQGVIVVKDCVHQTSQWIDIVFAAVTLYKTTF